MVHECKRSRQTAGGKREKHCLFRIARNRLRRPRCKSRPLLAFRRHSACLGRVDYAHKRGQDILIAYRTPRDDIGRFAVSVILSERTKLRGKFMFRTCVAITAVTVLSVMIVASPTPAPAQTPAPAAAPAAPAP